MTTVSSTPGTSPGTFADKPIRCPAGPARLTDPIKPGPASVEPPGNDAQSLGEPDWPAYFRHVRYVAIRDYLEQGLWPATAPRPASLRDWPNTPATG